MSSRPSEPRIKVLRIISRMNIGGPAIHVTNLNSGLDPDRYISLLVSGTENPGEGSLRDLAESAGVEMTVIPQIRSAASLGPRDVLALFKLYRLMRRERPQIVHTHESKAGFLGRLAARIAGVPIVLHTYHGHVLRGYYGPLKSWALRCMEQLLALLTDRLIAVSEQVKCDLVQYRVACSEKISVVPLGFDLEPFLSSEAHRGSFRREMNLNGSTRLVGIVGRLFPIKNHRLFLDAAALVTVEEPASRFVVVGDGVLRQELDQYARDLSIRDMVIFTGWRRDLPRIYADLDVLVVSSDNEGTPVSVIESMASGCPVVATRVGGIPDVISDGDTGYLVPAGDADALASRILSLLRDDQEVSRLRASARAYARDRYNLRRLISDIQAIYENLISKKGLASHSRTAE